MGPNAIRNLKTTSRLAETLTRRPCLERHFWAKLPHFHGAMKQHILIYGLLGGILITLLKLMEYRFLVLERSVEIYGALIAAIFASVGIWLGWKLTRPKERVVIREVPITIGAPFLLNE